MLSFIYGETNKISLYIECVSFIAVLIIAALTGCPGGCRFPMPVFLNRQAAARYRALASIIPGRERPEETTICYQISLVQLMYVCIYRVQSVFLLCPTPRLHCFLSSHWPSLRLLSFLALFISSIQFFFGLPRTLFCFGIHFNAILGSLSSAFL